MEKKIFFKEIAEGKIKTKTEIKNGEITDIQQKENKQENKNTKIR